MMMPPYHGALLRADEQGMIEHFKIVADAWCEAKGFAKASSFGLASREDFTASLSKTKAAPARTPEQPLVITCGG